MKISVVLPCQNEEKSIGVCIERIRAALWKYEYEIIVSDSSNDRSAEIAKELGAKLIKHNIDGYGNAIIEGVKSASGDYIIIGDADNTYNFLELPNFIRELEKGYDLVIGNRFSGRIERGAMPFSHRYIGTPLLNLFSSVSFGKKISDINSGFRGIRADVLRELRLNSGGMEFASEMIVKSIKKKLKIREIPISYSRRIGKSKLNTYGDGYRHLRFMLLTSPNLVFLVPGLLLLAIGFLVMILLMFEKLVLFNIQFRVHPSLVGMVFAIVGYQLVSMGYFAKIYMMNHLDEENSRLKKIKKYFNLENSTIFSLIFFSGGIFIYLYVLGRWLISRFGELNTINLSIFATTLIIMGVQTFFSGFFFSMINEKSK
jgi:glycosyltransferase involved in cell wall biosynthesis